MTKDWRNFVRIAASIALISLSAFWVGRAMGKQDVADMCEATGHFMTTEKVYQCSTTAVPRVLWGLI